MPGLKTKVNEVSVDDFINSISDDQQRADSKVIRNLMEKITGNKGKMYGSSIIGFGSEKIKYASGKESEWMSVGFSPRKGTLTLYVLKSEPEKYSDLLGKLGKHTIGKGCLYIKKLSDVNLDVVEQVIKRSSKLH